MATLASGARKTRHFSFRRDVCESARDFRGAFPAAQLYEKLLSVRLASSPGEAAGAELASSDAGRT